MINVDVTKISSKGQVVIPQDMRKGFSVGEKFIIIKGNHEFILKPINELKRNFIEDIDFARKTMKAIERYEKGKFREMDSEKFLAEIEKW